MAERSTTPLSSTGLNSTQRPSTPRAGKGRTSTRERIVEHADRLFYEGGYERTSFADIARRVGISRGNFHHHFKAKDDILSAVIDHRREQTSQMLAAWEAASSSPEERIRSFIDIVVTNRVDIEQHGCPVGTLCSELAKSGHPNLAASATLFTSFREWLRQQFVELGVEPASADDRALHLLVLSQGIAVLANTMDDDGLIDREVDRAHRWLDDQLAP